jgi:hypothetical protein
MSTDSPVTTDFRIFVQKIAMQGFYALGMIEVPGAPKQTEPNFEVAQAVVEDLEMLRKVTEGNLSEGERLTLEKFAADLKYAYVQRRSGGGDDAPPEA